jgi:hypothetical protein
MSDKGVSKFWRIILLIVVCAAVCGGYLAHRLNEEIQDAYAVSWVSNMVISYMKANGNAWPKSWEDLRKPYETMAEKVGRPWSFEQLQSRVEVDWKVDPKTLIEGDDSKRVIWLRSGTEAHWESREPNEIIREYLKSGK